MEYCFTTNFDLLETAKFLSPWLLAGLVYLVWHKQKGKEVIANEAKEIIKNINIYKLKNTTTFNEILKVKNESNYFDCIDYDNRNTAMNNLLSSILFLNEAVKDKDIIDISYDLIDLDRELEDYFIEHIKSTESNKPLHSEKILIKISEIEKSLGKIKIIALDYALYKKFL